MIYVCNPTEAPVEFLKPLTDQRVKEYQTATFECEVSKPNLKATWRKGDTPLEPSDRLEMVSQGNKHTLTIKGAELTDVDKYTVVFEEGVESTAALRVDGELYIQILKLQLFLRNLSLQI